MAGNSATAAICTISGMTALGIKCNKPDCNRREKGNKRVLVRLDDHLGGKKGGGSLPSFFSQTVKGKCHTHSHKPARAKASHCGQSLGVCCLFSQDLLKKAEDRVFHASSLAYTLWPLSLLHSDSFSPSACMGFVFWASGNPHQRECELLFMSLALKRVLYSSRQGEAKGERERRKDELLKWKESEYHHRKRFKAETNPRPNPHPNKGLVIRDRGKCLPSRYQNERLKRECIEKYSKCIGHLLESDQMQVSLWESQCSCSSIDRAMS